MDTNSLFLALAEENLYDCIRPEKKGDWEKLRENDCRDSFRADSKTIFFSTINESLVCSKKNLGVRSCYVYAARLIVAMTTIRKDSGRSGGSTRHNSVTRHRHSR